MPTIKSPIELDRIADHIMREPGTNANLERMKDAKLVKACLPESDWERRYLLAHTHRLLNLAVSEKRMDRVHALLEAGAPVVVHGEADDQDGWTLLHHLVMSEFLNRNGSNLSELDRLIQYPEVRAALNCCTVEGNTALFLAISENFDAVAARLIELGAHLNASQDSEFETLRGRKKVDEWKMICGDLTELPLTAKAYAGRVSFDLIETPIKAEEILIERADHLIWQLRVWDSSAERVEAVSDLFVRIVQGFTTPLQDPSTQAQIKHDVLIALKWMGQEDEPFLGKTQSVVALLNSLQNVGLDPWARDNPHFWKQIVSSLGNKEAVSALEHVRLNQSTHAQSAHPRRVRL